MAESRSRQARWMEGILGVATQVQDDFDLIPFKIRYSIGRRLVRLRYEEKPFTKSMHEGPSFF